MAAFRYDRQFEAYASSPKADLAFLQSLFDSNVFLQQFPGLIPSNYRVREVTRINAAVVNMNVFDIFRKFGAVYGNGTIASCPETFTDNGVICENELKRCLFDDNHECYGEIDHNEFIVQLLEMVVLGGPYCQYEDNFHVYADLVRSFYKALMSVVKDNNRHIRITSTVYRICDPELFVEAPRSCWNRCYVIVNSALRQASFVYMPRSDQPW